MLENHAGEAEEFAYFTISISASVLTEALKLKFPKNKCIPRTEEARAGWSLRT